MKEKYDTIDTFHGGIYFGSDSEVYLPCIQTPYSSEHHSLGIRNSGWPPALGTQEAALYRVISLVHLNSVLSTLNGCSSPRFQAGHFSICTWRFGLGTFCRQSRLSATEPLPFPAFVRSESIANRKCPARCGLPGLSSLYEGPIILAVLRDLNVRTLLFGKLSGTVKGSPFGLHMEWISMLYLASADVFPPTLYRSPFLPSLSPHPNLLL